VPVSNKQSSLFVVFVLLSGRAITNSEVGSFYSRPETPALPNSLAP